MKKWALIFVIAATIFSCDNNDEIQIEERLEGNWEHSFSVRGSEQTLSFTGVSYDFKTDNTYTKELRSFDWRDEGTWAYKEDTRILSLNYKTYANQISDTQSLDLKIETITDKDLVLRVDFNDTNIMGEFVEFEFIHYLKK